MLKKKYYDGFTVHDILNKHVDDGHKILELLTAFADADGVDAVEVIRCKDCVKKEICSIFRNARQEFGFCAWACRRDTDDK